MQTEVPQRGFSGCFLQAVPELCSSVEEVLESGPGDLVFSNYP